VKNIYCVIVHVCCILSELYMVLCKNVSTVIICKEAKLMQKPIKSVLLYVSKAAHKHQSSVLPCNSWIFCQISM